MKETLEQNLENRNGNYIFPFLWMHGENEQTLRKMMQVIYDANIRAVCVESRPHPEFCGNKWWQDMDVILDEARKRKMQVWILDDAHFPTGYANGAIAKQPARLRRQGICYQSKTVTGNGKNQELSVAAFLNKKNIKKNMYAMAKGNPKALADLPEDLLLFVYAISGEKTVDLTDRVQGGILRWDVPQGEWKIAMGKRSWRCGAHPDYINMTDAASCRVLIDAVYEPHWQHYKADFGRTIAGFFSDEPELGNGAAYARQKLGTDQDLPWSDALAELLQAHWGEDWMKKLPYLWENELDAVQTAAIRAEYMDLLTKQVQTAFSEQLGQWCESHGVEYIGHVVEDMGGHARTGGALGHYFRGLWGQHMAGIDDIGGQVYPQGDEQIPNPTTLNKMQERDGSFYHYELPRLAASLAALDPKKQGRAMCEIFGNYGWLEGLRMERYLADHFMVSGVNRYVPHAFSGKKFPDADCPPHFYAQGHNPQYKHFGSLMAYMNRVCGLISGGRSICNAAVLYHAEGEWAGNAMMNKDVLRELADHQINADIVPLDAFAQPDAYHFRVEERGAFRVNTQCYQVLIVPYMQYVCAKLVSAVKILRDSGVDVIFINALPETVYGGEMEQLRDCPVVKLQDLAHWMDRHGLCEIEMHTPSNRLRYLHYEKNGEIYYFVNEGTKTYRGDITVPTVGAVCAYDPWRNCLEKLDAEALNGRTRFHLELEPLQSIMVIFGDLPNMPQNIPLTQKLAASQEIGFSGSWQRGLCKSIQYPNFTGQKKIRIPDDLAKEKPGFSGWVCYENSFHLDATVDTFLTISEAWEGVEVFVNGISAGVQITPPYLFDLSHAIKQGRNALRIEVSTTLERERARVWNKGMIEMVLQRKQKDPTGITGRIQLFTQGGNL